MDERHDLAERFEAHRARLRALAWKMLGSASEADDAVQEAWLRLDRAGAEGIDNLGGWLTTVVARVCLDALRSRRSRREDPAGPKLPDLGAHPDPEREALLADAIGKALLVVLETLAPAERVAFVLHDLFAVPFDEVSAVLGRSTEATRQLASRARRRVRGARVADEPAAAGREVVAAFLQAARGGDVDALLALLDPEVVVRADGAAVRLGALPEVRGSRAAAAVFVGPARGARAALVDGAAGAAGTVRGRPVWVFGFTIIERRIVGIEMLADPERLGRLAVVMLEGS